MGNKMKICDKEVSLVGLGTWGFGGGYWSEDYSEDNKYIDILLFAYEKGINLFDTAEMYGNGHAEELIGRALKDYQEKVFIISKVWPNHLYYDSLVKSAIKSRERLKIRSIDLYLIHWPNKNVKIEESIKAMEYLIDKGIIRCMGVSNFDVDLLNEAINSTKKYEIVANEIEYNVYNKWAEKDLIPFANKNGVKIIAYSPLGKGRVYYDEKLKEIGKKYGKTSVQIALNYLIRNSIPIPKSANKNHIEEIMGSIGFSLTDDDYEYIKKL
jgi:diketogulonate reductase-like aldo/keto reductase